MKTAPASHTCHIWKFESVYVATKKKSWFLKKNPIKAGQFSRTTVKGGRVSRNGQSFGKLGQERGGKILFVRGQSMAMSPKVHFSMRNWPCDFLNVKPTEIYALQCNKNVVSYNSYIIYTYTYTYMYTYKWNSKFDVPKKNQKLFASTKSNFRKPYIQTPSRVTRGVSVPWRSVTRGVSVPWRNVTSG